MKKIMLLAAGILFLAAAQAQEGRKDHDGNRKHHKGMMMHDLNLSESQKTELKAINEDFRKQMAELQKSENTLTVADWKSKRKELASAHKAKIQSILTAEQKSQIEKMKTEQKAKRDVNEKGRMDKMKTHLGLTDDQVAKLTKNRADMEQKMKAIRENKSLSDEQKKEQIKELMKTNKESMKSIFTEEQLEKMKEGRKMDHKKGDRTKGTKGTI